MKKILAIMLALCVLLSLTACTRAGESDTSDTGSNPNSEVDTTGGGPNCEVDTTGGTPALPDVTVENPVTFVSISYSDENGVFHSLSAYDDDDGKAYVEYVGQIKKVGKFDLSVLHNLTEEIATSGLTALNGQSIYEDGTAYGSVYVLYGDESYLSADYSGTLPEEFLTAYGKLESFFQLLTANLPEYVPQPIIMGDVNADALAAMQHILSDTGIKELDTLSISDVTQDEFFGITLGLTDTTNITSGTICAPIMLASAYSFVIVTVSEDADIDAIRNDFATHLEWNKWICVSANRAAIAQKDNMILCLMGSGGLYSSTFVAIQNTGWTDIETFENPNA